jgi:hypothetical protein
VIHRDHNVTQPKSNGSAATAAKERVLHARIPESLDEAIRARASGLGMSVSNLVRNVLGNALEVVEAATGRVPTRATEPAPTVLAWQDATLNINAVCDRCNAILPRGTRAALAIPDPPTAQRAIRCLACLEELRRDPDAPTR